MGTQQNPAETKLYYLQSRYYNPEIGRFINADVLIITSQGFAGYDMFAYCLNNPVNYSDFTGNFAITATLVGAIVGGAIAGALIGATSYLVSSGINGTEISTGGLLGAIAVGALNGGIGGAAGSAGAIGKVVLSAGAGIISGIYAGVNTDGSIGQKIATGFSTGIIAAGSTCIGASIDTGGLSPAGSAFANFSTTLAVGVPAEIAVVSAQQAINNLPAPTAPSIDTILPDSLLRLQSRPSVSFFDDYLRRRFYGEMPTFP